MQRTLPTHTETITVIYQQSKPMHTFTIPLTELIAGRYQHVGDATVMYTFVLNRFIFAVSYPNKYCARLSNLQVENACNNHYNNLVTV